MKVFEKSGSCKWIKAFMELAIATADKSGRPRDSMCEAPVARICSVLGGGQYKFTYWKAFG